MKALFVHSARFVRAPDGTVYSNGQFPYRNWDRYLNHFDELTVVCRMSDVARAPEGWNVSSGPRVSFAGTPDDHGKPLMQLMTRQARGIIREQLDDCDAVIVRQSSLGWLAAREARRRGIPWAVEVVGDAWAAYWNYGSVLAKLYAPVSWWESRIWIGRAKFAIYVTREYLQKLYPCYGLIENVSNVVLIGVADVVINACPHSVVEKKVRRWQMGERDVNNLRVGMIGSLFNRYKGLHVALRSLRRLKDKGKLLHLYVLGDGKLDAWRQEAVRIGVEDLLHLEGSLPNGGPVMQWLDNLDIYIQPSLTEGLPRAIVEAMSRGLPVLSSMVGGIPELLQKECLHKAGDDKTLAQQLERLMDDIPWRIEQSYRNFSEAGDYYSDKLEARRDAFWGKFAEYARKRFSSNDSK